MHEIFAAGCITTNNQQFKQSAIFEHGNEMTYSRRIGPQIRCQFCSCEHLEVGLVCLSKQAMTI